MYARVPARHSGLALMRRAAGILLSLAVLAGVTGITYWAGTKACVAAWN